MDIPQFTKVEHPTHPRFIDMTGEVWVRLTVQYYIGLVKNRHSWLCLCSCDKLVVRSTGALRSGQSKSCGCLREEHRKKLGEEWAVAAKIEHQRRESSGGLR